jgi:dCMP deaminase
MATSHSIAVAYIPVLHQGYFSFLNSLAEKDVEALYLISDEILAAHDELDYLNRKDRIRALPQKVMMKVLFATTRLRVEILTRTMLESLGGKGNVFHMPREDVNLFIASTYLTGESIEYHNVSLRRNQENIGEARVPDTPAVTLDEYGKTMMGKALQEAEKSTDWWRHVGAALAKKGEIIACTHNEHMPDEELPNVFGDARALFKKGLNINYVTSAHAEVGAIGEAARKGISTEGAELFVTDFPCPYCARLIAKAGIKTVYYLKGYAVLDGDIFFKDMGIATMRVLEESH